MHKLLWYNGKDPAQSVWTPDEGTADTLARALKAQGYTVVWTIHSTDKVRPQEGYESELRIWQELN